MGSCRTEDTEGSFMAIIVSFTPASLTATQYDDVIKRLDAAGAGAPAGRLFHACYGSGNAMRVVEVWDSPPAFQAFGQTLMPILQQVGVDPGQPEVSNVHNILKG